MEGYPFVHRFKTEGNYYIYDVNTNCIFCVDEITYALMEDYGTLISNQIINKHKVKVNSKILVDKLNIIEKKIEENKIFSSHRPKTLKFADSLQTIRHKLDSGIEYIILNITDQCNMRCTYCTYSGTYADERTHSNRYMSFEIAQKAVDFYILHSSESKKRLVIFYGGEPLLNIKLIKDIVNYINKKYKNIVIDFNLNTNGVLLDQNVINFLIENKFSISVSLNGPRQMHDKHRILKNGTGTFDKVVQNLKMLKQHDQEYYNKAVTFIVTIAPSFNLVELERFFSSFDLMTANNLLVTYVNDRDTTFFDLYDADPLDPKIEEYHRILTDKYIEEAIAEKIHENKFLDGLYKHRIQPIIDRRREHLSDVHCPKGICIPGTGRLFVSTKGDLFICERMGEHICVGNVKRGFDLEAIFGLMEKWRSIIEKECINCWALRLCKLCFVQARKGEKLDVKRLKECCGETRKSIDQALRIFTSVMEKNNNAFRYMKSISNPYTKV
jgi:uncharacterized protein